jgi:hypothetical protein
MVNPLRFIPSVVLANTDTMDPPSSTTSVAETVADGASALFSKMPEWMKDAMETYIPNTGRMGDSIEMGKPAVIDSQEFGQSSATPAILQIPVSAEEKGLVAAGKKAHDKFFGGYPDFDFNVNFSCAKADLLTGKSAYADPRSPWWNVFFGRYQIDAPIGKDAWKRPLGFTDHSMKTVSFDDITRIGNSDWGYFSNWMYGVPDEALNRAFAAQKAAPAPKMRVITDPLEQVPGYTLCEVDGILLPSAYVSGGGEQALTTNEFGLTQVWQRIFGKQADDVTSDPAVKQKYPNSFVPTSMKMRFYLKAARRFDPVKGFVYTTSIYGGGVNKTWAGDDPVKQAYNERFLQAQMDAVKKTMPR